VVEIELPPLRQRGPAEIAALATHFLGLYSRRHDKTGLSLGDEAVEALSHHTWPGNVRELEHSIERAVVLADDTRISPEHLGLVASPSGPPSAKRGVVLPHGLTLEDAAARYTEATIAACEGNQSEAARRLGVGRNTLARKLRARR
jgi:Nif-specific regulatory protein